MFETLLTTLVVLFLFGLIFSLIVSAVLAYGESRGRRPPSRITQLPEPQAFPPSTPFGSVGALTPSPLVRMIPSGPWGSAYAYALYQQPSFPVCFRFKKSPFFAF